MGSAYFDYQSSTPVLPEVWEAMRPYWTETFASASALHRQGLAARDALARAREQVAAFVNAASPEEILFTSGGTESANLAVKGAAWAGQRRGRHLVLTAVEHPAVDRAVAFLERHGFTCTRVPVDREGRVAVESVRAALREETILICVQHANPDVGTIQPVGEVGELAAEQGIPLLVDGTASGGWLPVDVQALGASYLTLAPHRFYGPKGVGILYRNRRAPLEALHHGGLQEGKRRAGTENVPAIVGAGAAAACASRDQTAREAHVAGLQWRLWEGIRAAVPYVKLNGPEPGPGRLSTNLNMSVEFVEGEGLALMCDVQGVALASGSSCVSRALQASPILEAMGLDRALARANVILSLGKDNTDGEVQYFLEVFPAVVEKLRGMSAPWEEFQRGEIDSQICPREANG